MNTPETLSTLTLVLTAVGSVVLLLFSDVCSFTCFCCTHDCFYWCRFIFRYASTTDHGNAKGMAGTLGFLAIVVALGAMFGKIYMKQGH